MQKIYYVESMHFHTPGIIRIARYTLAEAQKEALGLVNLLRDNVKLQPETDPTKWEEACKEARFVRYAELNDKSLEDVRRETEDDDDALDFDIEDDGYVFILEMEIPDFPATAT
jgi:hypothetical protein